MTEYAPYDGGETAKRIKALIRVTRDWLRPQYNDEAWKKIADASSIYYQRRSVTKSLVSLCMFHGEKTPSFWMRPSGNYDCYGCSSHGDIATFIFAEGKRRNFVPPDQLLGLFGSPPQELLEIDPSLVKILTPAFRAEMGQLALFSDYELDGEPF